MKCEIVDGQESWMESATGEPQFTNYGCFQFEIIIPTAHGDVVMMIDRGDPCEMTQADIDAFKDALERKFREAS